MKGADSQGGSPLLRVVGINEQIKRIAATAFQVNMMALNAILLARRAGRMALGFSVLSNELREFIRRIEDAMARLGALTQETVRAVSQDARQEQIHRCLRLAEVQLKRHDLRRAAALTQVLESRGRLAGMRAGRSDALRRSMLATLQDAGQLGQYGLVLARTARIEATYGGEFSEALVQVAVDFDATINEIIRFVATLSEFVEGGSRT
jgi:hypothetical protein